MRLIFLALVLLVSLTSGAFAQNKPLTVFGAADLRYALDAVVIAFNKEHPNTKIETIYGSSGKAYAQIRNGAPYDLYFSANIAYPESLIKDGFGIGEAKLYAIGRIVLWQRKGGKIDLFKGISVLNDPAVKKVAIANPEHAPYGVAAMQTLKTHGMWDGIQPKLVMGENISQAAHFAASGAADVGIIAYSLALAPEMKQIGEPFVMIDYKDHKPLRQGYMITKTGANHPLAKTFAEFIEGKTGKEILKQYGFEVPTE
ncbi:molybdate ABC transporter substrate-binding protein [Chrysiogenes arsenatis]|uniref:molybdate ABC transporter substrate-binding protein n=1 Tax=Chrysiogenes arsenatis TaxID=309797 RepID=UPI000420C3C7|nr:molybdate ABC transporter substrate-binding protein [Chrysiogenes arsenatis]